jgi:hypothetical protein
MKFYAGFIMKFYVGIIMKFYAGFVCYEVLCRISKMKIKAEILGGSLS